MYTNNLQKLLEYQIFSALVLGLRCENKTWNKVWISSWQLFPSEDRQEKASDLDTMIVVKQIGMVGLKH